MGAAIIEGIQSGLAIITDLAKAMVDALSSLFWDPTLNTNAGGLTVFGTFAVVFLGIAIAVSIVTAVVSLVKANTSLKG